LPVSPSIVRLDAGRSHGSEGIDPALAEGEEVVETAQEFGN